MFKPNRLRRAWHACGAWGRRDPTLFIASFAASAILNGLSLLATNDTFSRSPVYSVAREIGVPENFTGSIMVLNGLGLLWGLGDRPPRVQSALALLTGILWCFWAFMLGAGGWRYGFYSSSAGWNFLMSLALMRVSSGFLYYPRSKPPGRPIQAGTEEWDD